MVAALRKMKLWASVCRALGQMHWASFPAFGKDAWKREHLGGFVSKLARFPLSRSARCIVDVGANVGSLSAAALAYCPQADVWAFEPSSRAGEELRIPAQVEEGRALIGCRTDCCRGDDWQRSTSSYAFSDSIWVTGNAVPA